MRRLTRPPATYGQDLELVLKPAELQRLRNSVKAACLQARRYARHSPALGHMQTELGRAKHRAFFKGLYDSRRKAVIAIRDRVRADLDEVTVAKCQYCGLAAPKTLDHFLGKASIPELAVFAPNLIPCCWDCNHGRGATFDANGDRRILHFYDDDVQSLPDLLTATITFRKGQPVVSYDVPSSTDPLSAVYKRHFDALGLKDRYADEAAVELPVIRGRVRAEGLSNAQAHATLRAEADARNRVHGTNDFKAALCHAIVASNDATTWVTGK